MNSEITNKMNNYLITGKVQAGKSTLIKRVCEKLRIEPCGYLTLPKYVDGIREGFYYHSLTNVVDNINDQMISKEKNGIDSVFASLGCETLRNTLLSDNRFVVLDEIGRFERKQKEYIELLNRVLDSNKIVLASLKKEDIEFINEMKRRQDTEVIDLDEIQRDEAYEYLVEKISALL